VWLVFFWLQDYASPLLALSQENLGLMKAQLHKYAFKQKNKNQGYRFCIMV
jgi:hypothetical protein